MCSASGVPVSQAERTSSCLALSRSASLTASEPWAELSGSSCAPQTSQRKLPSAVTRAAASSVLASRAHQDVGHLKLSTGLLHAQLTEDRCVCACTLVHDCINRSGSWVTRDGVAGRRFLEIRHSQPLLIKPRATPGEACPSVQAAPVLRVPPQVLPHEVQAQLAGLQQRGVVQAAVAGCTGALGPLLVFFR